MSATEFPVIEVFGPVLQGEGAMIGKQTMFVRFGGCDFRCTYCDSYHAIMPEEIQKRKDMMSAETIIDNIDYACNHLRVPWVTLSGGNPALWELGELVTMLQAHGHQVALEVQGTKWKPWIAECDLVTISPKGPGMIGGGQPLDTVQEYVDGFGWPGRTDWNFKIVIFDLPDLDYAVMVHKEWPDVPMHLSIGNNYVSGRPGTPNLTEHRQWLLEKLISLEEKIVEYPSLADTTILPQLHVLMHGNAERR